MAARMRTIRDALKTIKELDPGSAVTLLNSYVKPTRSPMSG